MFNAYVLMSLFQFNDRVVVDHDLQVNVCRRVSPDIQHIIYRKLYMDCLDELEQLFYDVEDEIFNDNKCR